MTYTLFFIPEYQFFQNVFFMFPWVIFFTVFAEDP